MLEYLYIIALITFIFVFIFLIYISSKKYILEIFPNKNIESFRQNLIQLFLNKKWNIEIKKDYIHIENGSFTAVNLYLNQNGQNVEVYYISSATIFEWMLILIGVITFMIMTIIVALIVDNNSKNFAKNTIHPILIKIKEKGFKVINKDFSNNPKNLELSIFYFS